MKKYKICVYAIAKNEEKFVNKWCESMAEADEVYVLDTGSTDNTVELLRKNNVHVETKIIKPWRFDVARNESLKMIPEDTDICVCTDLDEVLNKGWRKILEENWNKSLTRAYYTYNWSLDKNNNPIVSFYNEKIHTRNDYKWTHPVHEVLSYIGNDVEKATTIDNIILNHYPDYTKSRSNYLNLLEMSVKEDPTDDRNMHYLGREYMYYQKYDDAIKTLKKHLKLKTATWRDERCASLRFIGRCYTNLKDYKNARKYYKKAILEAPYLRDSYVELALLEFELGNYKRVEKYCLKALTIKSHQKTYINETFSWDNTIYDLLSISCYHLNKIDYALYFVDLALQYTPSDQRLLNNRKIFKEKED